MQFKIILTGIILMAMASCYFQSNVYRIVKIRTLILLVLVEKQIRFKHFFLEIFQNHHHLLLINYSLKYIWIIFLARAEVYIYTSILNKKV